MHKRKHNKKQDWGSVRTIERSGSQVVKVEKIAVLQLKVPLAKALNIWITGWSSTQDKGVPSEHDNFSTLLKLECLYTTQ